MLAYDMEEAIATVVRALGDNADAIMQLDRLIELIGRDFEDFDDADIDEIRNRIAIARTRR